MRGGARDDMSTVRDSLEAEIAAVRAQQPPGQHSHAWRAQQAVRLAALEDALRHADAGSMPSSRSRMSAAAISRAELAESAESVMAPMGQLASHAVPTGSTEPDWEAFFSRLVQLNQLSQAQVNGLSDALAVAEDKRQLMINQLSDFKVAAQLQKSDLVRIHGLQSRPALNGKLAMVLGRLDPANARVPITTLDEVMASVQCKPEHISLTVPTRDDLIVMWRHEAACKRNANSPHWTAEAAALLINATAIDPRCFQRDHDLGASEPAGAGREGTGDQLAPSYVDVLAMLPAVDPSFERLLATIEEVPIGSEPPAATVTALVERLDTRSTVDLLRRGQDARDGGAEPLVEFLRAKQRAMCALKQGHADDDRCLFFGHMCQATDILCGGGLIPGARAGALYNLGCSFQKGVCAPMTPLMHEQLRASAALAAFELSCEHSDPSSPAWVAAHSLAGEILMEQDQYAKHETARLQRAVDHFEKARQGARISASESDRLLDLLTDARQALQQG